MFVYQIQNTVNGHCYYGKSTKTKRPNARWNEHRWYLLRNKHQNSHLQNAWNKYGEQVFEYSIVEHASSVKELSKIEVKYLNREDAIYNIRGSGGVDKHSEETKKKMSETAKKITRTNEVRKQRSEQMKKMWKNPEYRQMMSKEMSEARKKQFRGHPELWKDRLKKANKASVNSCKKVVKLVDPDGNIHETVNGIGAFEREHKLSGLRAVISGHRTHHKRWKLYNK